MVHLKVNPNKAQIVDVQVVVLVYVKDVLVVAKVGVLAHALDNALVVVELVQEVVVVTVLVDVLLDVAQVVRKLVQMDVLQHVH